MAFYLYELRHNQDHPDIPFSWRNLPSDTGLTCFRCGGPKLSKNKVCEGCFEAMRHS